MKSVMECERSVIRHDYLISGFGNCVNDTPVETGLSIVLLIMELEDEL